MGCNPRVLVVKVSVMVTADALLPLETAGCISELTLFYTQFYVHFTRETIYSFLAILTIEFIKIYRSYQYMEREICFRCLNTVTSIATWVS